MEYKEEQENERKAYEKNFTFIIKWGLRVSGIIFFSIVSWRLANSTVSLTLLNDINFNDLLAIIMALFSILISILFYFKSSESSDKFYNNSYTFTKGISEAIGRLDERVEEKLVNLRDSSSRMETYLYQNKTTKEEAEKEQEENIKEKEEEIKEVTEGYQKQLETALTQAKIDKEKREDLLKKLQKAQDERDKLIKNLSRVEFEIEEADNNPPLAILQERVLNHLQRIVSPSFIRLTRNWDELKKDMNPFLLEDMRKLRFIDENNILTAYGRRAIRNFYLAKRTRED